MVYVLTTKEGKEWRPIAVVDENNKGIADQWANASKLNDWVPLEMNDLTLTSMSDLPLEFKPTPPVPMDEQVKTMIANLEETNTRLIGIIEQLAERYKDKDILKAVQRFKRTGSKRQRIMVPWNLLPQRHAPSCPYRAYAEDKYKSSPLIPGELSNDNVPKCNCLTDKLPRSLQYPEGHVGCADCEFDEADGHWTECPRMKQRVLFAANKWKGLGELPHRRWKELSQYEKPDLDRILAKHAEWCSLRQLRPTEGCTCKPCAECGAKFEVYETTVLDEPHKPDCSAMTKQKKLFENELLRKQ